MTGRSTITPVKGLRRYPEKTALLKGSSAYKALDLEAVEGNVAHETGRNVVFWGLGEGRAFFK